MFVRRSVRLNPACASNQSPNKENNAGDFIVPENQNQLKQEQNEESPKDRYFNSPNIQNIIEEEKEEEEKEKIKDEELKEETNPDVEKPSKGTPSATSKALNKMDLAGKRKMKKTGKMSVSQKRKLLNQRLSRLLTPKSALILLHELKPNCVYKVQEQPGCIPPSFFAQVLDNDEVLGSGQGLSKSHAKNSAAENAIKAIVSKTMANQTVKTESGNDSVEMNDEEMEDTPENLPWAGLASFAIYKMFSEWQSQGSDLLSRTVAKPRPKAPSMNNYPIKKELPPNAVELHPAVVLNLVFPGLTASEVEREDGPKCKVKMAYSVNGKIFTGVGANKKFAKREAAKAVLEGLYGLTYPQ